MISFFTGSGGAGLIRGKQIAERLKAKLNPKEGYKKDICIYVKKKPPKNYPTKTYIDVVEDSAGLRWAYKHREIGIIASSRSIYNELRDKFLNIHFIREHHCNYERELRDRDEVKVAGIIGNKAAFQYPFSRLEKKLNKIGLELKTLIKKRFTSREEVVDFYKGIDIQLVWRPKSDGVIRNPLKLTNACSFGIPTISYPEENMLAEYMLTFIQALSIDEMIEDCKKLKEDKEYYNQMSLRGVLKSEGYHIDTVCKLYKNLDGKLNDSLLHT